VTTGM